MDWHLIVAGLCAALAVNLTLLAMAWWYLADRTEGNGDVS